jgi:hypothetical protein
MEKTTGIVAGSSSSSRGTTVVWTVYEMVTAGAIGGMTEETNATGTMYEMVTAGAIGGMTEETTVVWTVYEMVIAGAIGGITEETNATGTMYEMVTAGAIGGMETGRVKGMGICATATTARTTGGTRGVRSTVVVATAMEDT